MVVSVAKLGADADRVSDILKVLPVDDAVLDPGDTLFFHSNLLHKSNRNDSAHRRWAFLIAYNRASNTQRSSTIIQDTHH